eukprot:GFUD01015472.1.p1 GENE.GFUD01015472.1~~GFUD01015472.1.p1  ORF type:complete len:109 (+),score=23.00 GFUD01015472.1:42-329(+)
MSTRLIILIAILAITMAKRSKRETDIHRMNCNGSVNSSCEGKKCLVQCSDGGKIELECEKESVDVNSDSDGDGMSRVECKCGDGKPMFRACFPFC